MKTHALMIGLSAGLALTTVSANAALTHSVDFDGYTDGPLHLQGGSDLGFGANTWFDDSLNSTVTGGVASTSATEFNLAFHTFDQNNNNANGEVEDALADGVHYLSFTASANPDAFFAGLSLKRFFGGEVLYIGRVENGGTVGWGMDGQTGAGGQLAGGDLTQDTFIVIRITIDDIGGDTAEMWLNPALGVAPPGMADLTIALDVNDDDRRIDEIRLGSQNGALTVDNILIGSEYADVAVPEPGSLALLGLGGLAMLRRRR